MKIALPVAPPAPTHWYVDPSRVAPGKPIRAFGNGLCTLLAITAVALSIWTAVPGAAAPALILSLVSAIVTIVWLYRARMNTEGLGRHRRAKGWVIGAWFCPVVNLWFPLQIVEDITRIDLPADQPNTGAPIRYTWWTCWLLSWLTGFHFRQTRTAHPNGDFTLSYSFGVNFGGTVLSRLFAAAAAIMLAVVVAQISTRQELRYRSVSEM